ncbi:MAG: hypothetical protein LBK99_09185 [Opitutaceae bacterium]|jgi:hypothetical protein|nr:hypothetical protein [Opitutaceae bacterium]
MFCLANASAFASEKHQKTHQITKPRANNSDDRYLDFNRLPKIYFRMLVEGPKGPVRIYQSLGQIDVETARRVRDALVETLNGAVTCARLGIDLPAMGEMAVRFGVEGLLDRLGVIGKRKGVASIGDVIAAFMADAPGRNIDTETGSSGYKAISALRLVIRTVHGEAATTKGPASVAAARTTAASTVNQARMVVSERAMTGKAMRALRLPDLAKFRAWKPDGTTRRLRKPVDDLTLARLRSAMDDAWFNHPARWLAATLCGNLGLRRGSAVMAR